MRLSRIYLGLTALAIIAAILFLLNEQTGTVLIRDSELFFGTALLTLLYAVLGMGCAAVYENGRAPRLMRSGMSVGLIALVCWIAMIHWPPLHETYVPTRYFIWPTVWACLMPVYGLLLLLPMHTRGKKALRAITLGLLAAFALFIACAIAFYPDYDTYAARIWDESLWEKRWRYERNAERFGGALLLPTAGALVTCVIVGLVGALTGRSAPRTAAQQKPYWLECPRCRKEQQAMTGVHYCVACGLQTRIDLT